MERRNDPWGEFLRRILLSASLASVAAVTPDGKSSAATQPPGMEEPEPDGAEAQAPGARQPSAAGEGETVI